MAWPTPQDYNEAIQNPKANFYDPDLRTAKPELTKLGLPRPITGNFASVYRMSDTGRDVAVRCFFREFADMPERYAAISACLNSVKLPYTVGFTYLANGIKVRAGRYPVLKMDWVKGNLLDEYMRANLTDGKTLRKLAESMASYGRCAAQTVYIPWRSPTWQCVDPQWRPQTGRL